MKKVFFLSFIALLGFAPHVLAQGFTALAPIPGLTDISPTSAMNANTLATFFNNFYKYLIGLAAVLAVLEIIWHGIRIATSKDNVSSITDSKGHIYNAIFGLILVLSPVLVFSIINPSILNLSLNLPPLNLTTTPSAVAPTPTCTTSLQKNCTPAPAKNIGSSATAPTGQYCFERTNTGAANDFVCASTQAVCDTLYKDNMGYDQSAVSSCILR